MTNADKIESLKAAAYDTMVIIDRAQQQLRNLNTRIGQLAQLKSAEEYKEP